MASNDNPAAGEAFKCGFCDRIFSSLSHLETHKSSSDHHGTSDLRYRCPHCNFAVNYGADFYRHTRAHRAKGAEKTFKCNYCTKAFLSNCELQLHERTHTAERPFRCQRCGKMYKRNSDLNTHVRRTHERFRPY